MRLSPPLFAVQGGVPRARGCSQRCYAVELCARCLPVTQLRVRVPAVHSCSPSRPPSLPPHPFLPTEEEKEKEGRVSGCCQRQVTPRLHSAAADAARRSLFSLLPSILPLLPCSDAVPFCLPAPTLLALALASLPTLLPSAPYNVVTPCHCPASGLSDPHPRVHLPQWGVSTPSYFPIKGSRRRDCRGLVHVWGGLPLMLYYWDSARLAAMPVVTQEAPTRCIP